MKKLTKLQAMGVDDESAHKIEEICRTYQLAGIPASAVDLAACIMTRHIPKRRWHTRFKWWLWRQWGIYVRGETWLKLV